MKLLPLLNKTLPIKEKTQLSGMDALLNLVSHIKNCRMQNIQPQDPRAKQHVLPPKKDHQPTFNIAHQLMRSQEPRQCLQAMFNTTHQIMFNTTHQIMRRPQDPRQCLQVMFNTAHRPMFNTAHRPMFNTAHRLIFNTAQWPQSQAQEPQDRLQCTQRRPHLPTGGPHQTQ